MTKWEYGDKVELVKVFMSRSAGYKDLKVGQVGVVKMIGPDTTDAYDQYIWAEFNFGKTVYLLGLIAGQVKKVGK